MQVTDGRGDFSKNDLILLAVDGKTDSQRQLLWPRRVKGMQNHSFL